jgi:hypothetical protein
MEAKKSKLEFPNPSSTTPQNLNPFARIPLPPFLCLHSFANPRS